MQIVLFWFQQNRNTLGLIVVGDKIVGHWSVDMACLRAVYLTIFALLCLVVCAVQAQLSTVPNVIRVTDNDCNQFAGKDTDIEAAQFPGEITQWLSGLNEAWVNRFTRAGDPGWAGSIEAAIAVSGSDVMKISVYSRFFQQLKPILHRLEAINPTVASLDTSVDLVHQFELFGLRGMLFYPRSVLLTNLGVYNQKEQVDASIRDDNFNKYLEKIFALFANKVRAAFEITVDKVLFLSAGQESQLSRVVIPSPISSFEEITGPALSAVSDSGYTAECNMFTGCMVCGSQIFLTIYEEHIKASLEEYHRQMIDVEIQLQKILLAPVSMETLYGVDSCRNLGFSSDTWQPILTGIVPAGLMEKVMNISVKNWDESVSMAMRNGSTLQVLLDGIAKQSCDAIIRFESFDRCLYQTVELLKSVADMKSTVEQAVGTDVTYSRDASMEESLFTNFKTVALTAMVLHSGDATTTSFFNTEPSELETFTKDAFNNLQDYFKEMTGLMQTTNDKSVENGPDFEVILQNINTNMDKFIMELRPKIITTVCIYRVKILLL